MPQSERIYEFTYLASPDLDDAGIEALRTGIDSLIVKSGGSIREFLFSAKRRLAYPVRSAENAYIVAQRVTITAEAKDNIAEAVKLNPKILRHNFVQATEKMIQRLRPSRPSAVLRERTKATVKPTFTRPQEKPTEEKKVDIAEIEKKLDEILGRGL